MGGFDPALARARAAHDRRRRRAAEGHVLAAFRRVGASRKLGPPTWDPTPAQRTGTRLHGRGRHGQRAAAFEARRPEVQAAMWAALEAGDLRRSDHMTPAEADELHRTLASLPALEAVTR